MIFSNCKQIVLSYHQLYKGWHYLRNAGIKKIALNSDSAIKYAATLTNTTEFIPNDSRFEALKSSGQIDVIENDSLQNLILDLYQNRIASLKLTTSYITNFKTQLLLPFLSKNMRFNDVDGTTNLQEVIGCLKCRIIYCWVDLVTEAMERYHVIIDESKQIIDLINKQYK